jgi:hypothetical protein
MMAVVGWAVRVPTSGQWEMSERPGLVSATLQLAQSSLHGVLRQEAWIIANVHGGVSCTIWEQVILEHQLRGQTIATTNGRRAVMRTAASAMGYIDIPEYDPDILEDLYARAGKIGRNVIMGGPYRAFVWQEGQAIDVPGGDYRLPKEIAASITDGLDGVGRPAVGWEVAELEVMRERLEPALSRIPTAANDSIAQSKPEDNRPTMPAIIGVALKGVHGEWVHLAKCISGGGPGLMAVTLRLDSHKLHGVLLGERWTIAKVHGGQECDPADAASLTDWLAGRTVATSNGRRAVMREGGRPMGYIDLTAEDRRLPPSEDNRLSIRNNGCLRVVVWQTGQALSLQGLRLDAHGGLPHPWCRTVTSRDAERAVCDFWHGW